MVIFEGWAAPASAPKRACLLGGTVVNLTTESSQLGRAEPIEDSAEVVSAWVDSLVTTVTSWTVCRAHGCLSSGLMWVFTLPDPGEHLLIGTTAQVVAACGSGTAAASTGAASESVRVLSTQVNKWTDRWRYPVD
jgi:hypothetical protein